MQKGYYGEVEDLDACEFIELETRHEKLTITAEWLVDKENTYTAPVPTGSAESSEEKPIQLQDCFQAFTKTEELKDMNKFRCTKCKDYMPATKTMTIWKLPDIVAVQLKRFHYEGSWREKVDSFVDFPLEGLDLAPFTMSPEGKQGMHRRAIYATNAHCLIWWDFWGREGDLIIHLIILVVFLFDLDGLNLHAIEETQNKTTQMNVCNGRACAPYFILDSDFSTPYTRCHL